MWKYHRQSIQHCCTLHSNLFKTIDIIIFNVYNKSKCQTKCELRVLHTVTSISMQWLIYWVDRTHLQMWYPNLEQMAHTAFKMVRIIFEWCHKMSITHTHTKERQKHQSLRKWIFCLDCFRFGHSEQLLIKYLKWNNQLIWMTHFLSIL